MVLLDEPSMGLAPQLVEEIFEIVRDLNEKEKVSFLLAEQNTNVALRYAQYGYILENGRVVMDGEAKALARERGRQGVLPRILLRRAARASATSSTTGAASAGSELFRNLRNCVTPALSGGLCQESTAFGEKDPRFRGDDE